MKSLTIIFLATIGLALAEARETYSAAVVEYNPIRSRSKITILERVEKNVQEYINILNQIQEPLDIIVFPESTLEYGAIPSSRKDFLSATVLVDVGEVPCKSEGHEDWFSQISCAAKLYKTYLSLDLVERSLCTGDGCALDKWNLYNTNVVFDRSGKIVAKYRKFNLFGEYSLNVTETAMLTKFKTDFGVEFGMFICFDIMFEVPPLTLVQQGVKHFIFPSMWFSQLPFLTSIQTQQMFAFGNDVVVLSSGANNPRSQSGGSGIFQGKKGTLVSYINGTAGSKVLISKVKKTWSNKVSKKPQDNLSVADEDHDVEVDGFNLKQEDLTNYTLLAYDPKIRTYTISLENFRCDFNVTSKSLPKSSEKTSYVYNFIGYSGARSFDGVAEGDVQVCALIACLGNTQRTCGKRISSKNVEYLLEFREVSVRMSLEDEGNSKQYPNSVTGGLKPLDVEEFAWKEEIVGGRRIRENALLRPRKNLLTFGIFGRGFQ